MVYTAEVPKRTIGAELPSLLAVPAPWVFVPEECETEYLQGLVEGRYDSMNAGDDKQEAKDIEAARVELRRRGVPV